MFLNWKNQHCENDYTTQSNLQIQCNPYQTTNGIFQRTRTCNFTICMETQKTPNSQSNLEKEEQSWKNHALWLQTILQNYSNQDSMVMAQKQKYRLMEQDRKPRDKPTHIRSPYLWQGCQDHSMEKEQNSLNSWIWDNSMWKECLTPTSYHINKLTQYTSKMQMKELKV